MKKIEYEEEGIATAVGMIFAILVFALLLSLFVTSYVPAEMSSFEEQYSSSAMNDMIQFMSTVGMLSLNYRQGESTSLAFNLQSAYVPIFSSPTTGFLYISQNGQGNDGYVYVSNSTNHLIAGGSLTVMTNNRYYVDEAFSYEFSSLFYEQAGSVPLVNSSLQYDFIQAGLPSSSSINLTLNLVNLVGGPNTISGSSPFSLTIQVLSKEVYELNGNATITLFSPLGLQVYNSTLSSISPLMVHYPFLELNKTSVGNNETELSIDSLNQYVPISLYITYVTIFVGVGSTVG